MFSGLACLPVAKECCNLSTATMLITSAKLRASSQGDDFEQLPEELWTEIFCFLEMEHLCRFARVKQKIMHALIILSHFLLVGFKSMEQVNLL